MGGIVLLMRHATRVRIATLATALFLAGLAAAGLALRSDGPPATTAQASASPATSTAAVVAPATRATVIQVPESAVPEEAQLGGFGNDE